MTAIKRKRVSFSNTCFAFALKLKVGKKTSKNFHLFTIRLDGLSANQFQAVHMNDVPLFEDMLTLNNLLYAINFVNGIFIGELASGSVQKHENTVQLLRCNNHISYVSNINAVFLSFHCPNYHNFCTTAPKLYR